MKRTGVIKVAAELLETLLQLPKGHKITNIWGDDWIGDFFIRVTGPQLPEVPEGQVIPTVTLQYNADGSSEFNAPLA